MAQERPVRQRAAPDASARHLLKRFRWWEGFILVGFAVPGYLYPSLGESIGALGAIAAIIVWGLSALFGALQANIISELSAAFPEKSGGIGILGSQAFRSRLPVVGVVTSFGYWFGWSVALSVNGLLVGDYLHATALPRVDPRIIGIVLLCLLYALNVYGVRSGMLATYILGILTIVPMTIIIIASFATGRFHPANLAPFSLGGSQHIGSWSGIALLMSWMFIAGWSSYGTEVAATLGPEFVNTTRDTPRVLRAAGAFSFLYYVLMPLATVGVLGVHRIQQQPYTAFVPLLHDVLGAAASSVVLGTIIASMCLASNIATIDGSRALYQMSRDRMTIRVFQRLNRRGIPWVGMSLDLAMNACFIWFLGTPTAILVAGNIGYVLAFVVVLAAFLVLRRTEPSRPRPIRLGRAWIPVAFLLAVLNGVFLVVGARSYGLRPSVIGVGVLLISVVLWGWRKWNDRGDSPAP